MESVKIGSKMVKGHQVVWMNNGRVYISRELFDACSVVDMIDFRANTVAEFQKICNQLEK